MKAITDIKDNQNNKASKASGKRKLNDLFWGYLLILPTVLGLAVFYIAAFFQNLYYSFTNLGAFGKYKWIGMENYINVFSDPKVPQALINTVKFTVISVPISIIISLFIATLLNSKIKGLSLYRTLYFLPAVTMPAAIAMMWKWLYNGQYGLLNQLLAKVGIEGQAWIADPKFAMGALIIVGIWSSLGMKIIYFLAGLQGIPKAYYEAATIDGAGPIRQFFSITLPSLTPTIFFVMITSLIGALQMFDLIFLMISKTSLAVDSTMSIVYLFYKYAFEFQEKGYASAISIVLFMIILVITAIQLRLQKKWVNY
ncbi:sugar ABC transporter permease [Tissierella sp. MB52-C2]|uniref:carbohydrate ABC transporter permease n=1 Tax=Tissierella sp. MB52-C2 TaxID=3070999 RepID=UPI00280A8A03|nr:sugar ABC transporter permease [Tissierella sp. MB52-C2]WMM23466.1 sugar ABC transporter permease [Tissierella sp. MB52-C2]